VRNQRISKRQHVQGDGEALRLRRSAGELTDAAGLLLVRKLWDRMGLGDWLDQQGSGIRGRYRPSLMVEAWVALMLYGGRGMDDLPRLAKRGVRRLFGWKSVPDPTTYGRWLRRAGEQAAEHLDALLWRMTRMRWKVSGVPRAVMLLLDSHVVVRYGEKQAGAEKGYNPKKRGRPSHHPLVAFLAETGDCMGVRWRTGKAHTAEGACAWIEELVKRLRDAGVERITLRLDKGFFSREMVRTLQRLEVDYVLKVPAYKAFRTLLGPLRKSKKDERLWTGAASLYGVRLLAVEQRRELKTEDGELELGALELQKRAYVLTNLPGVHALSAWRLYNRGTVVESRIKELVQLGAGATAVDDLGGNHLLWAMAALAYQVQHTIRTQGLTGTWRRAEPNRLRNWLFRMPAKLTSHARKRYVHLTRGEPMGDVLLRALRRLEALGPPLPA
jgi:hypothetical protein